jgi:hypothetical protein
VVGGGRILSVSLDWTQAAVGPLEVDVGHLRWNLAADYGLAAADRFQDLYVAAAHRELRDQPRWDLVTLMDLVLDMDRQVPAAELAPLRTCCSMPGQTWIPWRTGPLSLVPPSLGRADSPRHGDRRSLVTGGILG